MRRAARATAAVCLSAVCLALPAAAGQVPLTLTEIAVLQIVEVSLDVSRYPQDRVATIEIRNPHAFIVRGAISRCDTVFAPEDAGFTALRPSESGNFVVGPRQTIKVTRLFRPLEPGKRPPAAGTRYRLAPAPGGYEATWKCAE